MLGLIMGFAAYMSTNPLNNGVQGIFFTMGLLLSGSIFTSMIFTDLSDKKRAIAALILPASHFEKYFLAWLYSSVIFLVIYIASFYLVDFLVVNMDNWQGKPKEIVNIFSNNEDDGHFYFVLLIYLFLHAVCIWGAIFFHKLHFIKTGFLFFISMAVLALLNSFIMKAFIGKEVKAAIPFGPLTIKNIQGDININLPEEQQPLIAIAFILIAVVLWAASYLRLKEKEV